MKKLTLKIDGMNTPCCAEEVKEALLKVKGVKNVPTCCPKRGIAEIEIEPEEVTDEQLIKVVCYPMTCPTLLHIPEIYGSWS